MWGDESVIFGAMGSFSRNPRVYWEIADQPKDPSRAEWGCGAGSKTIRANSHHGEIPFQGCLDCVWVKSFGGGLSCEMGKVDEGEMRWGLSCARGMKVTVRRRTAERTPDSSGHNMRSL